MARCSRYALLQLDAQPPRDERLNVGIVVIEDNRLEVCLPKSLKKIHAISAALDEDLIRRAAANLPLVDEYVRAVAGDGPDRLVKLMEFSPFRLSEGGDFYHHSVDSFKEEICKLLSRLVEPEPSVQKRRVKSSPLLSEVKKAFRAERVLAKRGEDLSTHRIVSAVHLAEGFSADLVLKNGAMHVVETVDASQPEMAVKRVVSDVAVSALTIQQAKIVFGETVTKGRIVYNASVAVEAAAATALDAAAHQDIELVNWASADDRRKFIHVMSGLAIPTERKGSRTRDRIHVSSQHRLKLN